MVIYVVKQGDSIYSIAKANGTSPDKIIRENEIINPTQLVVGQTLVLTTETKKLGTINVNGYVLPTTNMEVLRKTLPHLTFLSIFS